MLIIDIRDKFMLFRLNWFSAFNITTAEGGVLFLKMGGAIRKVVLIALPVLKHQGKWSSVMSVT